jgi:hypothetical protein
VLADLLDETAAVAPDALAEVRAFHRADVWTGRRSDRFGDELADRCRVLRAAAAELRQQAVELRERAELYDRLVGPFDR